MTKLEIAFQAAFCTTDVAEGFPVACSCGREHVGPAKQGQVADQILVLGCDCPLASSFGGLFWRHRHEVANYLRAMTEEMDRENVRLRGELPQVLGTGPITLDVPRQRLTCSRLGMLAEDFKTMTGAECSEVLAMEVECLRNLGVE